MIQAKRGTLMIRKERKKMPQKKKDDAFKGQLVFVERRMLEDDESVE